MTSPNLTQSLLAGAAAGTATDLLFFPIDTVKTRLQSAQGFIRAGGFNGVYQGVGSVVVGSAPGAALFFATYNALKQHLPIPQHLQPVTHVIAASVAEVVACIVRVPTEVIKTRSQTSTFGGAISSLSAAQKTLDVEGFRGFYRGFGITVFREIPFTSIQFPLYEFFKKRLAQQFHRDSLYAHEAAACGSVAGGIAAATTTPLDVLKTRVMLDMRANASKSTFFSHFQEMRRTESPRAFFAGALPRTLWISAGGAIFLGVYEWAMYGLLMY
ncbi:S-adenosylmethionine transporter [Hysterangium stoloniferum]|nr:S-adenosylmethionine transporter [Hysterangium stoloniferum]